ncbi:MAG: winged helix-turn-helix transcriptional regulator [Candidatus Bathyarchaeia archaeon]
MKRRLGLMSIFLAFVLAFSFVCLIQRQRNAESSFQAKAAGASQSLLPFPSPSCNLLAFPVTQVVAGSMAEGATLSCNSNRTEIYGFIRANPGLQFRAICSGLGLSIGVVQFHLKLLEKAGLVDSVRRGRYKRFFAAGAFSRKQMETIAALRLSTVRDILRTLLERKRVSHRDLAIEVCVSSQGLTWQMNRLSETGFVRRDREGLAVTYCLNKAYVPLLLNALALTETE